MEDENIRKYEFVVDRHGMTCYGEPKLVKGSDDVYIQCFDGLIPLIDGEVVMYDDDPFFFYQSNIEV